jgi:RNA polymerase sigma-70 factor (ECF subfamily)
LVPRLAAPATAPDLSPDHVTLMAALEQLPRVQREAIAMHHLADLPVNEIAAALGVPPGTVKARLSRGRAALAHLLEDQSEVRHV